MATVVVMAGTIKTMDYIGFTLVGLICRAACNTCRQVYITAFVRVSKAFGEFSHGVGWLSESGHWRNFNKILSTVCGKHGEFLI